MQPAFSTPFPEPLPAAMPQLSEKPRLGVRSWNPAPHPGQFVCNSRTAIGLQFGWSGIVSGTVVAPNNGKPPLTPQQKHDMICQTLDNITKGAAVASDIALSFSAGSFAVAGVAAINIEGAPISEPIAAGATVVGAVSGIGGLGIKAFQYGNTAFARWAMGCNNSW